MGFITDYAVSVDEEINNLSEELENYVDGWANVLD